MAQIKKGKKIIYKDCNDVYVGDSTRNWGLRSHAHTCSVSINAQLWMHFYIDTFNCISTSVALKYFWSSEYFHAVPMKQITLSQFTWCLHSWKAYGCVNYAAESFSVYV